MKKNKKVKLSTKNKKKLILFLIIAISILSVPLFTFARYVSENVWNYYLESKEFYFRSEQLNNNVNINSVWNGGPVYFELLNYNEANEVSEYAIEYTVSCEVLNDTSGNLSCYVNGSGNTEYSGTLEHIKVCRNDSGDGVDVTSYSESTCNDGGYNWIDGNTFSNQFFEIVNADPDTPIKEVDVRITATSTAPYRKTITGDFELFNNGEIVVSDDVEFVHHTNSTYETVALTNNRTSSVNYFIRWNAEKLNISKTDYLSYSINPEGFLTEIEFKIEAGETLTFDFFKVNSTDTISIDDFIIVEKPREKALRVVSVNLKDKSSNVTELSPATFTDNAVDIHLNIPTNTSTFVYEVVIENTTNEFYYLDSINDIINTGNLDFKTVGLSVYHEFGPGTVTTFDLSYTGNATVSNAESMLEIEFGFTQGEIYKDDVLGESTPEIIDGLLPIVYNETKEEWEKADVINGHWYDYSEMRWANAASVISSKKDFYVEAPVGTTIPMSDITAMLVWIPRFSYTIREDLGYHGFSADPVTRSTPGAIDIKFVDLDVTHTGSAEYTGTYATNWFTSSAFCWGNSCDDPATRSDPENKEVKGFWIAKFEASKVGDLLYSKPNVTPMIHYSISQTFTYVQSLMNGENGYENYGYVGYVDAHLIKNTEWGAIAYLSQSKYGKYGNTDYTGINKEIYLNNCSIYKTGVGGASAADGRTTATCDDPNHEYDSYNGMGASTTGNIYGVYDMIGGTFDRVMGTILDADGNFIPDYSGFTELPEGRYINVYPYAQYTIGDTSPIKGDALTETINYYDDRYLQDPRFSSTNYNLYHWIYRGGSLFFSNTDANGIFSYTLFDGRSDGHHSSRYTITMYDSIISNL